MAKKKPLPPDELVVETKGGTQRFPVPCFLFCKVGSVSLEYYAVLPDAVIKVVFYGGHYASEDAYTIFHSEKWNQFDRDKMEEITRDEFVETYNEATVSLARKRAELLPVIVAMEDT